MADYAFLTAWRVAAAREAVFEVLHESERWPEWWDGLESVVKLEEGDAEGRGSLGRYTWRSIHALPAGVRHAHHASRPAASVWTARPLAS